MELGAVQVLGQGKAGRRGVGRMKEAQWVEEVVRCTF